MDNPEDPQSIANFTAGLLLQQEPQVLTMMLTAFVVEILRRDYLAPDDMQSDEAVLYIMRLSNLTLSQLQAAQKFVAMLPVDARNSVH